MLLLVGQQMNWIMRTLMGPYYSVGSVVLALQKFMKRTNCMKYTLLTNGFLAL